MGTHTQHTDTHTTSTKETSSQGNVLIECKKSVSWNELQRIKVNAIYSSSYKNVNGYNKVRFNRLKIF